VLRELNYAFKRVLGFDKAGDSLTVFPDDTFIVSYPKSGNTWTRFLIGNLVHPEGADFSNINRVVPDPEDLSKRYLKRLPRPRILKSHRPFDPRYKRVICIVRDPRDVALSEYYFDVKRMAIEEGYPMERFVARFVAGDVNHEAGSWGENVGSWMAARLNNKNFRSGKNFLLLRYEDLVADPKRELASISRFLGIAATPERLEEAVERSSAERMRKLENAQAHLWSSTKDTRKDRPFVRAATSGGWRTELSAGCVAEIESTWGGLMKELGYAVGVENSVASG
jgi:Sulfotransferase domain